MRVSSNVMFNRMASTISSSMDRTMQSQNNLYYKVHKAGDNPAAQSQIMLLQSTIEINTSYSTSAKHAQTINTETGSYLKGYKDAANKYLAITEKAINGTANAEDRRTFAKEINETIQQVALTSNAKSYTGDYIFGGNATNKPPFEFTTNGSGDINGFKYAGNDKQRNVVIGKDLNVQVSFDGKPMFSNKEGRSIFDAMIELRDRLNKGTPVSPAEATKLKSTARSFADAAILKSTDIAVSGAKINTTVERYESLDLSYSTQLSNLQDSDFAQVTVDIARFKNMTKSSISTMQTVLKMSEDIIGM